MSLALVNDPSQKDSTGAAGDPGSTPVPNRDDAERFLAALDPTAKKFTFQIFDDNARRKDPGLAEVWSAAPGLLYRPLEKFNAQSAGVFVTINETDGKGREASNILRVRALFVDLDGAPLPETFHCRPHIITESSRGKWHVYWRVSDCALEEFAALQKRLAALYGGDPKVNDLSRVMRLPGFIHAKVDKHGTASEPFRSRLVEVHDHDAYTVEAFVEGLPATQEELKPESGPNPEPPKLAGAVRADMVRITGEAWHDTVDSR